MFSLRKGFASFLNVVKTNALTTGSTSRLQSTAAAAPSAAAVPSPPPPKPTTTKVFVDDKEIEVPNGSSVLQACEISGVDIPRFCYHERLSVAGNCRMCLVEVEKVPKPVASCAWPLTPGMRIKTNTTMVHKAREGVMEFLLSNHPLDCPICDQGGECDLQEQSLAFGSDRSRFREIKRSVEDKELGPLVKTVMTRCIHCTRCVRFSKEIAGVPTLGVTGRGNGMEIGTYVPTVFDSELSGNVIDVCPVGALTSKPYAFKSRPWELISTETVDVMDAVGSNIRVDCRGPDVMRVLPRLNEAVNEEWISDKTRFAYDGLKKQRLDVPMLKKDGTLQPASWPEVLTVIREKVLKVKGNEIRAIAGEMADAESMVALKDLMNRLGCENLHSSDNVSLPADLRSQYIFNSTIAGIEESDFILLVGTNPRMEAPMLNARIRKTLRASPATKVALVGPNCDLNYKMDHVGNDFSILQSIANKSHNLSAAFGKAKKPMVIVGMGALNSSNNSAVLASLDVLQTSYPNLVAGEWNGVNILNTSASRVAAQDIGFVAGASSSSSPSPKVVYLLGADSASLSSMVPKDAFVIYQGHNGDVGAEMADVILPGAAFTEKAATYVNLEGRAQRTMKAADLLNEAREDWTIIRALSDVLGRPLPYSSADQIHKRLADIAPHMVYSLGDVERPSFIGQPSKSASEIISSIKAGPMHPYLNNFFLSNSISRSSKTMALSSKQLPNSRNSYL